MGWIGALGAYRPPHRYEQFQSLRGFGVDWSNDARKAIELRLLVSIPERVWGGLEHPVRHVHRYPAWVSIPERVWGGLEPAGYMIGLVIGENMFQSLRGFGVDWSQIETS
ncbi:hypothetical protein GFS31_43860 (plasmid) [Leptolyngbya sp. BL0902]|nr:hypothetical protein GFS31_43860 [Leptolyngbya sp. BL0902]